MRHSPNLRLEPHRIDGPVNTAYGRFRVGVLLLQVSAGAGWDHVSVSCHSRCPTWPEMDHIKRLCFRDDEVVMQLHISDNRKVNTHEYCLHLWRPQNDAEIAQQRREWEAAGEAWPYGELSNAGAIPLPPKECV